MRRQLRLGFIVVGGSLLAGLGMTWDPYEVEPECKRAAQWVVANKEALPVTLPAFARHSRPYQMAIYNALPAGTRVSLWRENLNLLLATSTLTDVQRDYLRRLLEEMPAMVTGGKGSVSPEESRRRSDEAIRILGRTLGLRATRILGVSDDALLSARLAGCECNMYEDYCDVWPGGGDNCENTTMSCEERDWGCGLFGTATCNGICW